MNTPHLHSTHISLLRSTYDHTLRRTCDVVEDLLELGDLKTKWVWWHAYMMWWYRESRTNISGSII